MVKKGYDNEFKTIIVELHKSGISTKQLSEDYSLNQSMIRRWRREYEAKSGDLSAKSIVSVEELERRETRRLIRELKEENEILKKALRIFSKNDR